MTRPRLIAVALLLACWGGAGMAMAQTGQLDIVNAEGYWSFDEASGNATDSGGNGNTLTETSGTIDRVAGLHGNAADFEAADSEYFARADNASLSAGDRNWCFVCWVKPETITGFPIIASKGWANSGPGQREWAHFIQAAGVGNFSIQNAAGTASAVTSASSYSNGAWTLVILQYDAANDRITIQLSNGTINQTNTGIFAQDGTAEFVIGASVLQALYWDGLIDEAFFYNGLLDTDQRTWLYNSGAGRARSEWIDNETNVYDASAVLAVATEGGRWDNGVTDAAKLAAIANDSGLHLVMTGSSAVLHCGATSGTTPFGVRVDGGAETTPSLSGGETTLFSGEDDEAHVVDIRATAGAQARWIDQAVALEVSGVNPGLTADPDFGPVLLVGDATLHKTTMASVTANNYSSPNTFQDRGGECFKIRGKGEQLWVWVSGGAANTAIRLYVDDVFHSQTAYSTANYKWLQLATGLDTGVEHEYTIVLSHPRASSLYLDAVMFGGTGAAFSATAVGPKKIVACWGDSITECGGVSECSPYGQGYSWIARAVYENGAMYHGRGYGGQSTSDVAARIAGEITALSVAPDMIVMNPGRNNAAGNPFRDDYITLLQNVYAVAPSGARLVCIDPIDPAQSPKTFYIQQAIQMASTMRTAAHVTNATAPALDSCDTVHPTATGHANAAAWISPYLRLWLNNKTNNVNYSRINNGPSNRGRVR